jgi:hypothetical protein
MWFYLLLVKKTCPDPVDEIRALAELEQRGSTPYLKLSPRDDAPLKGAGEGEIVYFCTRKGGGWLIHGEATIEGPAFRGPVPEDMDSIYGRGPDRRWWRRLRHVRLYDPARTEADLGLRHGTLPKRGRAFAIHVDQPGPNHQVVSPTLSESKPALQSLTDLLDDAWDRGRLTPEAIDAVIKEFRARHPYRS